MNKSADLTKEQLARFQMSFQEIMEEFGYARTETTKLAGLNGISGKIFSGFVIMGEFLTDTGDGIVNGAETFKTWISNHLQFLMHTILCFDLELYRGIGLIFLTVFLVLLCLKFVFICESRRKTRYRNISWNQTRGKTKDSLIAIHDNDSYA